MNTLTSALRCLLVVAGCALFGCGYDHSPGAQPDADGGFGSSVTDGGNAVAEDGGQTSPKPGSDGGTAGGCGATRACDDRNPCTTDVCEADGTCTHAAAVGSCSVGVQTGCCASTTCCVGPQCAC